jgi:phycocyanin-associated, rod
MLGQSALTSATASAASSRVFVYEVEGLRQNDQADKGNYSIRSSSTVLISVPYSRMNEEMRRISRLGGKIVNIHTAINASGAGEASPGETPNDDEA